MIANTDCTTEHYTNVGSMLRRVFWATQAPSLRIQRVKESPVCCLLHCMNKNCFCNIPQTLPCRRSPGIRHTHMDFSWWRWEKLQQIFQRVTADLLKSHWWGLSVRSHLHWKTGSNVFVFSRADARGADGWCICQRRASCSLFCCRCSR